MHGYVYRFLYPVAAAVARPLGLYPFPKTHRRHLVDLFRALRINCVVDAGAHFGEYGQMLRGIGYKGLIVSFEPVSASYERLRHCAAKDKRWLALPYGLGAENKSATIHIRQSGEFNSLLLSDPNAHGRFEGYVEEIGAENISLRRLDSVFGELPVELSSPVMFLKMDTQGYDKDIVDGAQGILSHVAAMQSELPAITYYLQQPRFLETLAYYQSLGFDPTAFFPVNHEYDGKTVVEWDVVLARPYRQRGRADAASPCRCAPEGAL